MPTKKQLDKKKNNYAKKVAKKRDNRNRQSRKDKR
jgi:hypothetical protein